MRKEDLSQRELERRILDKKLLRIVGNLTEAQPEAILDWTDQDRQLLSSYRIKI